MREPERFGFQGMHPVSQRPSAPDVRVVLSGVLSDVVLRESWKLVSHQRVHSVKVDLQLYSQEFVLK